MMATTANQRIDVGALRNGDAVLVVDAHANERQEIAATLRYNYDQLGSQGAAIREHAIEIKRSEQQANSAVVEAGRHLLAVKEALPHGQWETWLETEFHMTDRTARTLMNIAERFDGKTEIISVLNVTVLGLLSAPSVPDAAVEAVAAAATNGKVTVATAKEIIAQHQPARPYLSIEEVLAGLRSTSLLDGLTGRQVWEIARSEKDERFIACQRAITAGRVRQHELINALYKIAEERGTKFDGTPVRATAAPQGERSTWDYWAAQGWRLVSDKTAAAQSWPHLAGLHDNAQLATPRLLSEAAVVHWLASGGKLSDQNYRDFAGYDTIRPAAAPGRSAEIEAVVRRQMARQSTPISVGDLRTIAKQRIGRLWRDCLAELPNSVQFSELSRAITNVADMLERTQPPAPPLAAPAAESAGAPATQEAPPVRPLPAWATDHGVGHVSNVTEPAAGPRSRLTTAEIVDKIEPELQLLGFAQMELDHAALGIENRCRAHARYVLKSYDYRTSDLNAALMLIGGRRAQAAANREISAQRQPAQESQAAPTDTWATCHDERRYDRLAVAMLPWAQAWTDDKGRTWRDLIDRNPQHANSPFRQDVEAEFHRRDMIVSAPAVVLTIRNLFGLLQGDSLAALQATPPQQDPADFGIPVPDGAEVETQLAATEAIAAGKLRQLQIDGLRSELNDALDALTRFGDITGKHTETLAAARELRRLIGLLDAEAQAQP